MLVVSALITRPVLLAVDHVVPEQQADDLVRRQQAPVAQHSSHAIGVPVGHKAEVVGILRQPSRRLDVVFGDGLGIESTEERIVLGVQRGDLAGRAREQLVKTAGPHSVKRLVGEAQLGLRNQVEVHQLLAGGIMRRTEIFDDDLLILRRVFKRRPLHHRRVEQFLSRRADG